jgi:hypothetical protein
MHNGRRVWLGAVLILMLAVASAADASCVGVMCGAYCGVAEVDYCVFVFEGDSSNACRNIQNDGCMSMLSLTCCPRVPRE